MGQENTHQNYYIYDTAIGKITIAGSEKSVTAIYFGAKRLTAGYSRTEITDRTAGELEEYFAGRRQGFDIPLSPEGTAFQKLVWKALQSIPYGKTRTYRQIAEMAGNPRACRAVGAANHKNPIPILIPCHRVIGSNGSLVGYAAGLQIKQRLLSLEKRYAKKRRD